MSSIIIIELEIEDSEKVKSINLNNRVVLIDELTIRGTCQDCTHGHVWKQTHKLENGKLLIIDGCHCSKRTNCPPDSVKADDSCRHWRPQ